MGGKRGQVTYFTLPAWQRQIICLVIYSQCSGNMIRDFNSSASENLSTSDLKSFNEITTDLRSLTCEGLEERLYPSDIFVCLPADSRVVAHINGNCLSNIEGCHHYLCRVCRRGEMLFHP